MLVTNLEINFSWEGHSKYNLTVKLKMCFYSRHVSMYQVCHRRGVRAQDRKDPYNMAAWRRCRHCVPFFKIQGRPRLCRSYPLCKYFMYVAKTCANLTKYSRKPENYNGTIIFEIDIMKNSSPTNLNLYQTWLFHKCFGCYVFYCFSFFLLSIKWVTLKKSVILV